MQLVLKIPKDLGPWPLGLFGGRCLLGFETRLSIPLRFHLYLPYAEAGVSQYGTQVDMLLMCH
jgi:hypothetical protein